MDLYQILYISILNSLGNISAEGQKTCNYNNSHDNVYGAVIMTKAIERVHPIYLMNVD